MRVLLIRQVDNGYAVWDGEAHTTVQMRINGDACLPRWVFVSPVDLAAFVSQHMTTPIGEEVNAACVKWNAAMAKRSERSV